MSDLCACGSGVSYASCCEPIIKGQPALTAEALMRSRYTAYVVGAIDHLERTCDETALPDFDRTETQSFIDETKWLGLEIYTTTQGGPSDETGTVDFVFRCIQNGQPYYQREIATFVKKDGLWFYHDSEINPKEAPARVEKCGRNDPCVCGSGKKYKKCCGTAA